MPDGVRAGFPVHWRDWGQGPVPALLLHCALAHSGAWRGVASGLADACRIAAPDMPGHGRSAAWDGRGDLHDQITAIAETFLSSGCHVVGHSFGATIALRLALDHGDRVASLTMVEPVLFAAARDHDPAAFEAYRAGAGAFAGALDDGRWREAARLFTAAWGDETGWDALSEAQREGFTAQMPLIAETQRCLIEDSAGLLRAGGLETLSMPVTLIRGDRTMPVMAAIHGAFASRIPSARDVVVPGAGHMLPVTHPEAVIDALRAHLAGSGKF